MERSLSALLPVHNVQSTLAATVQEFLEILPELARQFEVVIADDGSTDATIEVADELIMRYPQVVAVRHAIRRGRVAAIRTALERSTGEVLLLRDDDSDAPLNEVQRLWRATDQHEIVLGRVGPPPESRWPAWPERQPSARGGIQLLSRRVIGSLMESLVDQTTLLAALEDRGSTWHEIEIAHPTRNWGGRHLSTLTRRLLRPRVGQADGPGGSRPAPDLESGPKRPKYLARLKDFALGE